MRSVAAFTLLASGTLAVAANVERRWDWPQGMALEARQDPGTPHYECHENCGTSITLSREEAYCDNAEFNQRFQSCLECANTYNIWRYYQGSLVPAAQACGLSATPSPSGWEPTPEPTTTESPEPEPTTTDEVITTDEPIATTPGETVVEPEPTTTDGPIVEPSTPAEASSSEEAPVEPSTEAPVVSETPAVPSPSQAAPSEAAPSEAAPSEAAPSEAVSSAPVHVPSGIVSSEPCPESTPVYVPIPHGNSTTLCTTTSGAVVPVPSGAVPTGPGAHPSYGAGESHGLPSSPVSEPSTVPSFEASGATKTVGSFMAALAVAALAL